LISDSLADYKNLCWPLAKRDVIVEESTAGNCRDANDHYQSLAPCDANSTLAVTLTATSHETQSLEA